VKPLDYETLRSYRLVIRAQVSPHNDLSGATRLRDVQNYSPVIRA
jgi:hypothetical protein